MALPVRLFPDPIPLPVRMAELREQGRANGRTQVAHNRKPQRTPVERLGERRKRRNSNRRLRQWCAAWMQ